MPFEPETIFIDARPKSQSAAAVQVTDLEPAAAPTVSEAARRIMANRHELSLLKCHECVLTQVNRLGGARTSKADDDEDSDSDSDFVWPRAASTFGPTRTLPKSKIDALEFSFSSHLAESSRGLSSSAVQAYAATVSSSLQRMEASESQGQASQSRA